MGGDEVDVLDDVVIHSDLFVYDSCAGERLI